MRSYSSSSSSSSASTSETSSSLTPFSGRFVKRFGEYQPTEFAQGTIPEAKSNGGLCVGFTLAKCFKNSTTCLSKAQRSQAEYEKKSYHMDGLESEKIAKLAGDSVTHNKVLKPRNLSQEIETGSKNFTQPGRAYLYKNNHLTRFSVLGNGQCRYYDPNGGKATGKCSRLAKDVEDHLSTEYGGETSPVSLTMGKSNK